MAEVSGLVENIQEVCSLIRADAIELAALSLTSSPRRQANEVTHVLLTALLLSCTRSSGTGKWYVPTFLSRKLHFSWFSVLTRVCIRRLSCPES